MFNPHFLFYHLKVHCTNYRLTRYEKNSSTQFSVKWKNFLQKSVNSRPIRIDYSAHKGRHTTKKIKIVKNSIRTTGKSRK